MNNKKTLFIYQIFFAAAAIGIFYVAVNPKNPISFSQRMIGLIFCSVNIANFIYCMKRKKKLAEELAEQEETENS